MNNNIMLLIWSILVFMVIFLCNYFLVYKRGYKLIVKKKKKKRTKNLEEFIGISYLVLKYNVDLNKCNLNYLFMSLSFINAFIITIVFIIISMLSWNLSMSMLLGFVLLFGLIYAIYELLGRYLKKKGKCK
mgnify:FL=1